MQMPQPSICLSTGIKRILDDDINDMEVFLELKLAFAIKRYRENRTE